MLAVLSSSCCIAQNVIVQGTIQDPTGQLFKYGSYSINFVRNSQVGTPPSGYCINGNQSQCVQLGPYQGKLDSNGIFTVTLINGDNHLLTPPGSTWLFNICPDASGGGGNGPACTSLQIPVSGTVDISTQINAATPPIRVSGLQPMATAYADAEVSAVLDGIFYFNTSNGGMRCFYLGVWQDCGGGGPGGNATYAHNNTPVGVEPELNFIDGGVTFVVTDDPGSGRVNITASSCTGTVTDVSGTLPITSTHGATPVIAVNNATSSTVGVVQPDNTTITISSGVISAVNTGTVTSVTGTLPITVTSGNTPNVAVNDATSSTKGVVQPDNSTITISSGTISAVIPTATTIQMKNGGTNFGTPLSGAGSINCVGCTWSGTSPDFTVTVNTASHTICSPTLTFNPGAILSNTASGASTASCTGLTTSDVPKCDYNGDLFAITGYLPGAMLTIEVYATANTINMKAANNTVSTITPSSVTFQCQAVR